MSRRIISCPSALFVKGVTLKSGNLTVGKPEVELVNSGTILQEIFSAASLTSSRSVKMTTNLSVSSSKQQLDLKRLSSSSLIFSRFEFIQLCFSQGSYFVQEQFDLFKGNASWDEVSVPTMQTGGIFELAALKVDNPFKICDSSSDKNNPSSSNKSSRRSSGIRSRHSLSTLTSLKQEDEALKNFPVFANKKATWDEMVASFEVLSGNAINPQDDSDVAFVDTFKEKVPSQIDVQKISLPDLALLKQNGVFMYYSISSVMEAALESKQVDLPSIKHSKTSKFAIVRKSRISFESHDFNITNENLDNIPIVTNLFYDMSNSTDDEVEDDGDDLFISFLETEKCVQ